MKPVFVAADNIFSPIGSTTSQNLQGVINGTTGIKQINNAAISVQPFYAAAIDSFSPIDGHTRFESLCISSIQEALAQTTINLSSTDSLFILSTTKGNIELLENNDVSESIRQRLSLFQTAKTIGSYFKAVNSPLVVSNACISGLLAIIIGKRLLDAGRYKNIVVTGADVLSPFVISGFQSLHAMSTSVCKPFDKTRDGINLGECAATVVLTTEKSIAKENGVIEVMGGSSSNDANHISGPSRTGAELAHAVSTALKQSNAAGSELAFISAHGTATVYNDEMEAKAFSVSGLLDVPLHSLKGNFGHTLGAAGILESILTYRSLQQGIILPSKNFSTLGVSQQVHVNTQLEKTNKTRALKTASGFGGCNAALVYSLA